MRRRLTETDIGGHGLAAARAIRTFLIATVFLVPFLGMPGKSARAQNLSLSTSYLTPFPQTDRYQLRVFGDWLAAGLASGLQDAFKDDGQVQIADNSRPLLGLSRAEQSDLAGEADRVLATGPVNAVALLLGVNDRLPIRTASGLRIQAGSAEWKDLYTREAEKLIRKFKAANVAVYWVSLPILGNNTSPETVAAINDAIRQACFRAGVKFIDASAGFVDQNGGYSAYGPDLTGQTKRLRDGDGIGFTAAGNRKLASYFEIAFRRDLAQARIQRNIPLAGDDEEQARLVQATGRASVGDGTAGDSRSSGLEPGDAPGLPGAEQGGTKTPAYASTREDQPVATLEQGEVILSDLSNGLTAIAVVSSLNDFSARDLQRQTPLAERVYFRVLSKGEALVPKKGRADDFQRDTGRSGNTQN